MSGTFFMALQNTGPGTIQKPIFPWKWCNSGLNHSTFKIRKVLHSMDRKKYSRTIKIPFSAFLGIFGHFRPGRAGNAEGKSISGPAGPKMTVNRSISGPVGPKMAENAQKCWKWMRKWKFPACLGIEMTVLKTISAPAI